MQCTVDPHDELHVTFKVERFYEFLLISTSRVVRPIVTRRYWPPQGDIFRRPKNCVQAFQMTSLPWANPVLVDECSEQDELPTKGLFL